MGRRKEPKLLVFKRPKRKRFRRRKKKAPISLVGGAKAVRRGIETAKLFRLRHLQRKKKNIFD